MTRAEDPFVPGPEELLFVALGGAGEIGMNLNLYGCDGRWLMVDLGIGFGDESTPGIDVLVPDPGFIAERRAALEAIVVTHAHEDHLGAVATLWPRLRCPVYASPFAAAVLRRKLAEAGIDDVPLRIVAPNERFDAGPFEVEYYTAAHSIPEGHVLAIRTQAGLAVHATDWKLDPAPLVGAETDMDGLRALGAEGVDALLIDSTNAMVDGRAGSEGALRESLTEIVAGCAGRVAVACFSSNIARIETIAHAAAANDRQTCLVGRSMWRMVEAARETGYLADTAPFLTEHDAGYLPPERVVLAVTGSQGERRAALTRIAANDHPAVALEPGDTVIYSSRQIPGNEVAIGRVQNQLARQGIEVIVDGERDTHVSGHPAREELRALYNCLKPARVVPIHGEARHLFEQIALARQAGVADGLVAENGTMVRLIPGPLEAVGAVETGRLGLDGKQLVPLDGQTVRARHRIGAAGSAAATVVLDRRGRLAADPMVSLQGVTEPEDSEELQEDAIDALIDAIEDLPKNARQDDERIEKTARSAVSGTLRRATGKRPAIQVHVVRV